MNKYAELRRREAGATDTDTAFERLPSAAEFDAALTARHAQAGAGVSTADGDEPSARDLLVRLEFLAGIDTPDEDRQLRMSHQVQRLSSRLREGAATMPERELSELLSAWFAQTPQAP